MAKFPQIQAIYLSIVLLTGGYAVYAQDAEKAAQETRRAFEKSGNPIAKKAVIIKRQVEEANQSDLDYLYKQVKSRFPRGVSIMEDKNFTAKLTAKLKADKEAYVKIKQALDAKTGADRGSAELRTSLVKLIGTPQNSGILDDAVSLLENPKLKVLDRSPKNLAPEHNQITVLKTLWTYALVVADGKENLTVSAPELDRNVQLFYPVPLPKHLDPASVRCTGLSCSDKEGDTLRIPNTGFIYGGNFIEGKCRGIDCSAFLSHCAESSNRLSTMVMEYTWRELVNGEDSFGEKEKPVRQEFLEKWGMKEALKEFSAVNPANGEAPQPGDIVVWRWNKPGGGRDGHTVLYLAPVENKAGEFYSMEANREDDKSMEGIVTRELKLARANADTYILRRR